MSILDPKVKSVVDVIRFRVSKTAGLKLKYLFFIFYRKDILKWFIDLQLSEYVHVFYEAEDVAWIDKLDRRYAWFKKHLLNIEDKFGAMFPSDWELSEQITVEFCSITRYLKCAGSSRRVIYFLSSVFSMSSGMNCLV